MPAHSLATDICYDSAHDTLYMTVGHSVQAFAIAERRLWLVVGDECVARDLVSCG
jgi:hypothetical protein